MRLSFSVSLTFNLLSLVALMRALSFRSSSDALGGG